MAHCGDHLGTRERTRDERVDELAVVIGQFAERQPDLVGDRTLGRGRVDPVRRGDQAGLDVRGVLGGEVTPMTALDVDLGDLLARLRRLTDGYTPPADGCASYVACFAAMAELEADTHLHIHKENNVLFPMVVRMEAERAAMARA